MIFTLYSVQLTQQNTAFHVFWIYFLGVLEYKHACL